MLHRQTYISFIAFQGSWLKMDSTLHWKRPPGPINIWRIKESSKNGKLQKFIIQDIPEDRFGDVLDHLCEYFLADELLCSSCSEWTLPLISQRQWSFLKILLLQWRNFYVIILQTSKTTQKQWVTFVNFGRYF